MNDCLQEMVGLETRRRLDVQILWMADASAGTTKVVLPDVNVDVKVDETGSGGTTKNEEEITDVVEWKSQRSLISRPKPFITL
jgi:hypothetical protein